MCSPALSEASRDPSIQASSLAGSQIFTVLVVCTGNTCRSPFVERVFRARVAACPDPPGSPPPAGWLRVGSAGTAAAAGRPMEPYAAAQVSAHGGDASRFTARQLSADLVGDADLVLTATRWHRARVVELSPASLGRAFALLDFAALVEELQPGPGARGGERAREVVRRAAERRGLTPPLPASRVDLPDPIGGPPEAYRRMAEQVLRGIPAVVQALAR